MSKLKDYRYAIIRVFTTSTSGVLHMLVALSIPLYTLIFLRSVMSLGISALKMNKASLKIDYKDLPLIFLSSLCYFAVMVTFYSAIVSVSPSISNIVDFSTTALISVLFSLVIFRRVGRNQSISTIFLLIGLSIAIYSVGGIPMKSLILFAVTAILNNIEGVIVRKLKNLEAQTFLFYKNTLIVLILLLIVGVNKDILDLSSVSLSGYTFVALLSLVSFIGSYYLYKSFQLVGVLSTNLVLAFSPVLATTLLCLIFAKTVPFLVVVALIFITIGAISEVFFRNSPLLK